MAWPLTDTERMAAMKVLVTGAGGQLGYDVMRALQGRGHEGVGCDLGAALSALAGDPAMAGQRLAQLDITDEAAVHHLLADERPDAVVHCAAWTNVDLAEECEAQARAVNADGTRHIAKACSALGCKMAYISTDYVFDGQGDRPWRPDGETTHPLNVYGHTKLEGEIAVRELLEKYFIVRIAWVFGVHGRNFIRTMIGAGKKRDAVTVVCDQIGTPTYTADLARLLIDMMETEKYGCYHVTNEGEYVSWYAYCREFYRQYGLETKVIPATTAEYGKSKAARPANSRLDRRKIAEAGFEPLPDWKDAVGRYLKEAEL